MLKALREINRRFARNAHSGTSRWVVMVARVGEL